MESALPSDPTAASVAGCRLRVKVGSGGEGEVWDAVAEDGRRVALKLVRPEALVEGPEAATRGRWLVRIEHPSLVAVHRGGVIHRGPYAGWGFVEMEYIDGPSLAGGPADPWALERLAGVAEGLDWLHAGRWSDGVPLVHRDVKPANLVAAVDGLVLVDPSTLRGLDATELTRVGTPAYAAPEVVTGRFGPPVDVYSLAATAAALLTGARGAALRRIVDAPDAYDLPPGVVAALAADPAHRPASCRAALDLRYHAGASARGRQPLPARGRTAARPAFAHPHGGAWPLPHRSPPPDVRGPPSAAADWGAPGVMPRRSDPEDATRSRLSLVEALALLAALVAAPVVAWAFELLAARPLAALIAAVAAVHLVTHLVAGRQLGLALVLPPLAWADLLATRVYGRPRRRIWARATFTGVLLAASVAGPWAWLATRDARLAAAVAGAGVVLTGATAWAARLGPVTGLIPRAVLLPAWAVGAAILAIGDVLASSGRALAGLPPRRPLAGRALASVIETVRGPGRPALPWES